MRLEARGGSLVLYEGRFKPFHSEEYLELFIQILSASCEQFNPAVHAYCLMSSYCHLWVQTADDNLARAMQE